MLTILEAAAKPAASSQAKRACGRGADSMRLEAWGAEKKEEGA
jgi:hypothetical protein